MFAIVPDFAPVHEVMMTACERMTAVAPIIHQPRGQAKNDATAARHRSAARTQRTLIPREMGCVSWGSSAYPNALAGPIRWIRP
jgi:hypothetical protein